eukprot:7369787-Ditylum_brightwellii.AAC.1
MAGFDRDQSWYVPQCNIATPEPIGDKGAYSLLYKLLPFCAVVASQDGIYWNKNYPHHDAPLFLKRRIPTYNSWARRKLREVEIKEANRNEDELKKLNVAAQLMFQQMVQCQEHMELKLLNKIEPQKNAISCQNCLLTELHSMLRSNGNVATTTT